MTTGRSLPDGDDHVRLVGVDDREREDAFEIQHRAAHGFFEVVILFQILFDQVGDDLGIGFSNKLMIGLGAVAL